MGEIFPREASDLALDFTGERMTTGHLGQVEFEHLHRYFFAREFCRGKDVLDVAAGEGYGSAYLAQTAKSVVGIELSPKAVEHATASYKRDNIRFHQGDARHLALPDASFDVVTSFETIEHFFAQEEFLNEVCRVLRPGGKLIISSPDSDIYSYTGSSVNPFHVKELTRQEFGELLKARFAHCHLYAQRTMTGTVLLADGASPTKDQSWTFERRGDHHFEAAQGLPRAPFVLAVASNEPIGMDFDSFYIETSDLDAPARAATALRAEHMVELQKIRSEQTEERCQAEVSRASCEEQLHRMETARVEERRCAEAAWVENQRRIEADHVLQIEAVTRQIRALQEQLNAAQSEANAAKSLARGIESSTIWRWSAPLRKFIDAVHR
jgi:SAM-dependent methyltransferase